MSLDFSKIIEKAQNKINMNIIAPKDAKQLSDLLDAGLTELYINTFSKPPYLEYFTEAEVREGLMSSYSDGGLIFIVTNNAGKPVAMVMSTPLDKEEDIIKAVGPQVSPAKTSYFSEDMVSEDLRRYGISSAMKTLLLEANGIAGYTHVLLRTTANNYKQISAVSKAGAYTLKDNFQYVAQKRQNGELKIDKRGFYMFACDPSLEQSVPKRLEDVAFVRPGGNDTAIVFDNIPRSLQAEIGSRIQMTYPNIEQVMFVEKGEYCDTRGQMAGGEFCGNATRAYAFLLAGGKEGTLSVEVSGANETLSVDLTAKSSRAGMPIFNDLNSVKLLDNRLYRVDLNGIIYIVAHEDHSYSQKILEFSSDQDKKNYAKEMLDQYGLSAQPASGVIVLKQSSAGTAIEPFVYVRDANTLYYETGCGSGSTAAALVISYESGQSIVDLAILQPSGMALTLNVERNEDQFISASVGGDVQILYRGSINLSNEYKMGEVELEKTLKHEHA